ncbi:MAG: rRNA pseudouridine synthase [Planctomycetes bacterium]|nr:rRNA pseudouridine synthase [Planctomycetota bacterium]
MYRRDLPVADWQSRRGFDRPRTRLMARRHEDREQGERVIRSGARRDAKTRGAPTRDAPTRDAKARDAKARGAPTRGAPTRDDSARSVQKQRPLSRRSRGLVVTPLADRAQDDGKVRLNRFLAMSGVCSRRSADELIAGGRVEVNGEPATELGLRVDPKKDEVRVDGDVVRQERMVYVLLNKPKNVVCTNAKHEQKTRVIDLLSDVRGRVFTVGRLDLDSEGLIMVTNDGSFALEMAHPRFGVPNVYAVLVRGRVSAQDLEKARGGVWLAEGPTTGMQIRVDRTGNDRTYLKVMLREGKNREIRRVFAKIGFPVIELKRVRIGELSLHGLSVGKWRFMTPSEVQDLRAFAKREDQGDAGVKE